MDIKDVSVDTVKIINHDKGIIEQKHYIKIKDETIIITGHSVIEEKQPIETKEITEPKEITEELKLLNRWKQLFNEPKLMPNPTGEYKTINKTSVEVKIIIDGWKL